MFFAPGSINKWTAYPVVALGLVAATVVALLYRQGTGTTSSRPVHGSVEVPSAGSQEVRPLWARHRPLSGDSRARFTADRLAVAATSGDSETVDGLRQVLTDMSMSAEERVFACQKLALLGSGEAMQALFEAITMEADSVVKQEMCESLDLLTNEEGIVALASVAVTTDDQMLLQSVEDCLSRSSTQDTVMFLAELHGEFRQDSSVAGRLCAMLESVHGPQATPALAGLLRPESPTDLFRAAAMGLAKSPGRDAARELVNATRRPLSLEQRETLREVISAGIEPEHFPVFRDEAGETREEFWISAFSSALERERPPTTSAVPKVH